MPSAALLVLTSLDVPRRPGLFVTGTSTDVGKTVVAAAIALSLRRRGLRVGVCKVAATGCERRREGLVSADAEYLAYHADARHPLETICPQRFVEPLAPAVAAERAGTPLDWAAIRHALDTIAADSDVMVVEGVGGVLVPMDGGHTVLDLMRALQLPAVVVAAAGLGTINHTLLTVGAIRAAGVPLAGVVINRYPADADAATETNPAAIERWGRVPVLCLCPDEPFDWPAMPEGVAAAVEGVDWWSLAHVRA
jgi:dethiobiotin synthetase